MNVNNLISKEELLKQLVKQIENTGVWWDESNMDEDGNIDFSELENEYRHLVLDINQRDLMKMYDISLDDFCKNKEVDFVSETHESEIEFIHVTKKSNLENIKHMGLITDDEACFIPDLGDGIYGVDRNSEIGIDNIKTFLVDFPENELLLIKGMYRGRYNYCFKGENHEGYLVFWNRRIDPKDLSFEVMNVDDFLFKY